MMFTTSSLAVNGDLLYRKVQQSQMHTLSSQMKILLITDNHTPSGGAEKYFFQLKSLLQTIPNYKVASLGFGPKAESGQDYCILKESSSNLSKLFWRCFFHPLMYWKIRRSVKRFKPDVVHIHNIREYPLSLLRALKGYPVLQTVHDHGYLCPTAQNIHRNQQPCATGITEDCFWEHHVKYPKIIYLALAYSLFKIRSLVTKQVKKFITPSPHLANYMQANQFPDVEYVPLFVQQDKGCGVQPKANHFLFVGTLGKHKGTEILLEEFMLAVREKPDLVLNIIGAGPDEEEMRERSRSLGIIKNVNFIGWRDNVKRLYEENVALIFPSIGLESFGLVMAESMGKGRPVIGVNRGTSAWLINDGETGLLFDPHTRGDLAEKIVRLAEDPDYARQLGIQAQAKLAKRFNDHDTLAQLVGIYEKCVGA